MKYYFCFFEFKPLWNSKWVNCICLNNPILLTHSHDKVIEFKSIESLCPPESCNYCSNCGYHIHSYIIVELDNWNILKYINSRSINMLNNYIPTLYINVEFLDNVEQKYYLIQQSIKINYSWKPLSVPENGFQYMESIIIGKYMYLDQWKYC